MKSVISIGLNPCMRSIVIDSVYYNRQFWFTFMAIPCFPNKKETKTLLMKQFRTIPNPKTEHGTCCDGNNLCGSRLTVT